MEHQSFNQTHSKGNTPEIEDVYSGFVIIRLAPAYEGLIEPDLKEVEELKNYLANGHCSEYYSYREVVGRIDGLNKSKEIFHDFMKKYVEEEE